MSGRVAVVGIGNMGLGMALRLRETLIRMPSASPSVTMAVPP